VISNPKEDRVHEKIEREKGGEGGGSGYRKRVKFDSYLTKMMTE